MKDFCNTVVFSTSTQLSPDDEVQGAKVNWCYKQWLSWTHPDCFTRMRKEDFSFSKTINYCGLTATLTNS